MSTDEWSMFSGRELERLALLVSSDIPARDKLVQLIQIQVEAAMLAATGRPILVNGKVTSAQSLPALLSSPPKEETIWVQCVSLAMAEGVLEKDDVSKVCRSILGMCVWVSQWSEPSSKVEAAARQVADAAISLVLPGTS